MRFLKGTHYPHPPRGRGRRRYHVTDAAQCARRQNLSKSRLRSDRESRIIKIWIWQSCFGDGPRPSQRALARQLGVWPSYVCKVQKQSARGLDALNRGERATLNELDEARRFTARLRLQEPQALRASPGVSKQYVNHLVHTLPPRPALPPEARDFWQPRELAPERSALSCYDPMAHPQNCECRNCQAKAMIEAAIRRAKEVSSRI
jgi:hypothetical protein